MIPAAILSVSPSRLVFRRDAMRSSTDAESRTKAKRVGQQLLPSPLVHAIP